MTPTTISIRQLATSRGGAVCYMLVVSAEKYPLHGDLGYNKV